MQLIQKDKYSFWSANFISPAKWKRNLNALSSTTLERKLLLLPPMLTVWEELGHRAWRRLSYLINIRKLCQSTKITAARATHPYSRKPCKRTRTTKNRVSNRVFICVKFLCLRQPNIERDYAGVFKCYALKTYLKKMDHFPRIERFSMAFDSFKVKFLSLPRPLNKKAVRVHCSLPLGISSFFSMIQDLFFSHVTSLMTVRHCITYTHREEVFRLLSRLFP